jgi:hypothetical protein
VMNSPTCLTWQIVLASSNIHHHWCWSPTLHCDSWNALHMKYAFTSSAARSPGGGNVPGVGHESEKWKLVLYTKWLGSFLSGDSCSMNPRIQ